MNLCFSTTLADSIQWFCGYVRIDLDTRYEGKDKPSECPQRQCFRWCQKSQRYDDDGYGTEEGTGTRYNAIREMMKIPARELLILLAQQTIVAKGHW